MLKTRVYTDFHYQTNINLEFYHPWIHDASVIQMHNWDSLYKNILNLGHLRMVSSHIRHKKSTWLYPTDIPRVSKELL